MIVSLSVLVSSGLRQAAKETEALTAEQHARESIRIARTTRELLKKFAAFQKTFSKDDPTSESSVADLSYMDEDRDQHSWSSVLVKLGKVLIQLCEGLQKVPSTVSQTKESQQHG